MVFYNLVSQLPLVTIERPEDLVRKNKVVLLLGTSAYLTLGGLIYFKKLPESIISKLPDKKFLFLMLVLDVVLYFIIHRFQHGIMPPMKVEQLPQPEFHQTPPHPQYMSDRTPRISKKSVKESSCHQDDEESTGSSSEVNIEDDLESSLKKPGKTRQTGQPLPLEDDLTTELSEQPKEATVQGKDYFKNDEDKPQIENWDIDEFTHEEYLPEN